MKLRKIGAEKSEQAKAKRLYLKAFPIEERAPFFLLSAKAAAKNVDFWGIYDGGEWCGFIYIVNYLDLSYVHYFAVEDGVRGKGIGSRTLELLKRRYSGRRFFLAVERLDPEAENFGQRQKRVDFYKRCGFEPLGSTVTEGAVTYDLLGIGGKVTNEEYQSLMGQWAGMILKRIIKFEISE
ncbi:MAG: GNAT family N-acetyltransferase [Oscillospiraceae bacterium]